MKRKLSMLADAWIGIRERLVDALFGAHRDVLNNAAPRPTSGPDIVAEMRQALDLMGAEAFDAQTGLIDYDRLRQSDAYRRYRDECAAQLRTLDLHSLVTRQQRLAFWINLYNALVIDAVIAFGIRRSVSEVRGGILAFFRRAAYDVGGMRFSCDDVEHGILRANRGHPALPGPHFAPGDPRGAYTLDPIDPRIHFALNCASRSCPSIRAYEADRIDRQLDAAASAFINGGGCEIDPASSTLHLSRIFQWYAGDFGGRHGVIDFVLRYLEQGEQRAWLEENRGRVKVRYQAYDWGLNH
ncbi:MAG: DUF547 domain-containing protein [Anaerolineae bacterium]